MLMGGKARKYWKVEKIHEQFGIFFCRVIGNLLLPEMAY